MIPAIAGALCWFGAANAQDPEESPPAEPATEAPSETPEPTFEAWAGFSVEDLLLDMIKGLGNLPPIEYNPNTPVAYNVGAAYRHWRVDFKQGLVRTQPTAVYGKTTYVDLEVGHVFRKDRDTDVFVYFQNYRGFWLGKVDQIYDDPQPSDRIRGDIQARYVGATAMWHSARRYRSDVGEWLRGPHKLFVVAIVAAGSLDYSGFGGTDLIVPRPLEFQYDRAGRLFQVDAITLTPSVGYGGHVAVGPAYLSSHFTWGWGLQYKRMDLVSGIDHSFDIPPGGLFDNELGIDSEQVQVSIYTVQRGTALFIDDTNINIIQLRYGGRARVRF